MVRLRIIVNLPLVTIQLSAKAASELIEKIEHAKTLSRTLFNRKDR
jgi:hypothetical protein